MWGVSLLSPALAVNDVLRYGAAAIFFIVAGLFAFPAFRAFAQARTTIDPVHVDRASAVVATGVYRVTRNPMYVGMTSLLVSWAAYLAAPWTLLGPLVFVLFITRFQILPEERAMSAKFGAGYLEYKGRVRRWL
jgi:protein-S-isoprenylcysteine O-methyltransferase Ste14